MAEQCGDLHSSCAHSHGVTSDRACDGAYIYLGLTEHRVGVLLLKTEPLRKRKIYTKIYWLVDFEKVN